MISVRLIIDGPAADWILGKMARKLAEHVGQFGIVAEVASAPSDDVDINHWMLYFQAWQNYYPRPGFFDPAWKPGAAKHTALITHVDDPVKVRILRRSIPKILDAGICMSRMTVAELGGYGIDPSRLTYVSPAHDGAVTPRRIVVGITSRLYPDGRKREADLIYVARSMRLDAFRFEIFGDGWGDVAEVLRGAGAEVDLEGGKSDYAAILARLRNFDYYLYMGWDEGSMGTVDALAAGVKTITTPQGFHLDLPGGITHAFRTARELASVFEMIRDDLESRTNAVRNLTWDEYARKHALIWHSLVEHGTVGPADETIASIPAADLRAARRRAYARTLKSQLWPDWRRHCRFWVRAKLSKVKRLVYRRRLSVSNARGLRDR